jgi:hypothetical protein
LDTVTLVFTWDCGAAEMTLAEEERVRVLWAGVGAVPTIDARGRRGGGGGPIDPTTVRTGFDDVATAVAEVLRRVLWPNAEILVWFSTDGLRSREGSVPESEDAKDAGRTRGV